MGINKRGEILNNRVRRGQEREERGGSKIRSGDKGKGRDSI